MNYHEDVEEFQSECELLEKFLKLTTYDLSDRVVVAVFCEIIKSRITNQEHPNKAMDQVIKVLSN